jgi:phosphohistidine phosphatase
MLGTRISLQPTRKQLPCDVECRWFPRPDRFWARRSKFFGESKLRTLLFMRHAKSDWGEPQLADHDRELNDRGRRVAPQMGIFLARQSLTPDMVIASTAKRVQETLELMLAHWHTRTEVITDRRLYLASAETFYEAIAAATFEHRTVMVLGHNPGMAQLASAFVTGAPHFPTAAVLHLQSKLDDWSRIALATDNCHFVSLLKPKELKID